MGLQLHYSQHYVITSIFLLKELYDEEKNDMTECNK